MTLSRPRTHTRRQECFVYLLLKRCALILALDSGRCFEGTGRPWTLHTLPERSDDLSAHRVNIEIWEDILAQLVEEVHHVGDANGATRCGHRADDAAEGLGDLRNTFTGIWGATAALEAS